MDLMQDASISGIEAADVAIVASTENALIGGGPNGVVHTVGAAGGVDVLDDNGWLADGGDVFGNVEEEDLWLLGCEAVDADDQALVVLAEGDDTDGLVEGLGEDAFTSLNFPDLECLVTGSCHAVLGVACDVDVPDDTIVAREGAETVAVRGGPEGEDLILGAAEEDVAFSVEFQVIDGSFVSF